MGITDPYPDLQELEGFEDVSPIGQGGWARVYSAYQPELDRHVALKVFRREIDESAQRRFLRELQAMGRLGEHPNVIQVYASGLTPGGSLYFAMPLYRSGSMQDHLARNGPMSVDEALRVGVKLCGALGSAHAQSVVHGDVKPANVLFTSYREPVLADFGTARLLNAGLISELDGSEVELTPSFAPPERIDGQPPAALGDVYSLALTLAVGVGEQPWGEGASVREILAQVLGGVTLSDRIDDDLREVLERALLPEPEARPSAVEFGGSLRELQRRLGQPTTGLVLIDSSTDVTVAARRSTRIDTPPATTTIEAPLPADVTRSVPAAPSPVPPAPAGASWAPAPPSAPPPGAPPTPVASSRGGREWWTAGAAPSTKEEGKRRRRSRKRGHEPGARDEAVRKSEPNVDDPGMSSLLADRPTDVDLLDNKPLVDGLVRVLDDPGTPLPLTIAVTGRWGSGKSSFMLQLERGLSSTDDPDGRDWLPVWFDAWRFQSRELLWAGLARSMYEQGLRQQRSSVQRMRIRLGLLRRRHGWLTILLATTILLGALSWLVYLAQTTLVESRWSLVAGLGAVITGLAAVASLATAVRDPFHRSVRASSFKKRYDDAFGLSDRAERDIDNLIETLTAGKQAGAIVVFLDDLDRCEPGVVQQALVTVSEIFGRRSGDSIVFVLGLDLDIVTSVVESSLSDVREALVAVNPERSGLLGARFLEKVFQLHIALESPRRLPTERLLQSGHRIGVDARQRDSFLSELRDLPVSDAGELTIRRREAGLGTMAVDRSELAALRSAVRIRRSELLSHRATDVAQAERLVLGALRLTPRAVKRFDNTFRLQLQVAANTPGSELDYHPEDLVSLAKWTALRLFYPRLTSAVSIRVGLWEELEALSTAGPIDKLNDAIGDLGGAADDYDHGFADLLAIGLPESSLRRVPLETFAGVV